MRLPIGIAIRLLIGFAIGAAGMSYWTDRAVSVVQKTARDTQPNQPQPTQSYFLCQSDVIKKPSALIIKANGEIATQIIFPWKTDGDVFRIDQTTDLHYIASDTEAAGPDLTRSFLDLNRVTGDMYINT